MNTCILRKGHTKWNYFTFISKGVYFRGVSLTDFKNKIKKQETTYVHLRIQMYF